MGYINLPVQGGGSAPVVTSNFFSQYPSTPGNYFIQEYDIFPNLIAGGVGNLISSASGASAGFNLVDASNVNAGINSTEKALGVGYLNLGTTSTGRCGVGFGTNGVASVIVGQHEIRYGVRASLDVLSNGTDTYTVEHGLIASFTALQTTGVFFRYSHGTNSGRWQFCVGNGTITAADTGVAPTATVYQVLEVVVARDLSSATFYIDGTLVGTVTTGFPTGGLFPGSNAIKSAGTTGRGTFLDAIYFASERLSVR